jgi:hypothetical protein
MFSFFLTYRDILLHTELLDMPETVISRQRSMGDEYFTPYDYYEFFTP